MELDPEQPVDRVLEWYEMEPGEELVGEEPLVGLGLDDLRAIFEPDDDDLEMLLPYEIETVEEAAAVQRGVTHQIDLAAHTYFVAAYQPEP
jgi:hypothetical protein